MALTHACPLLPCSGWWCWGLCMSCWALRMDVSPYFWVAWRGQPSRAHLFSPTSSSPPARPTCLSCFGRKRSSSSSAVFCPVKGRVHSLVRRLSDSVVLDKKVLCSIYCFKFTDWILFMKRLVCSGLWGGRDGDLYSLPSGIFLH